MKTCRTCSHRLADHVGDYDCSRCDCDAFIPLRSDLPLFAATDDVMVAPPTARNVTPKMLAAGKGK